MDNVEENLASDTEALRRQCDYERRKLRDAVQCNTDVDAAAKSYALAFNAYQQARAFSIGRTVKRISAFHVLQNIGPIIASIKD